MKFAQLILSTCLLAAAATAHALDVKPYAAATLAQAQQAEQPVALHFHADWCPTCRAQAAALQTLKAEPGLPITVLVVDYDTERELKRRFRVNAQSTLLVLRGQSEVARLVGDTSVPGLRAALRAGL